MLLRIHNNSDDITNTNRRVTYIFRVKSILEVNIIIV